MTRKILLGTLVALALAGGAGGQVEALIRLEVLRIALACARFQAAQRRMPLTVRPELGARPLRLDGDTIAVPVDGSVAERGSWKIGRR